MTVLDTTISTPLSSTSTLSVPPSPGLTESLPSIIDGKILSAKSPLLSASTVIERIASRANTSSTVFIYDLAEQVGFGALTKNWSRSDASTAPIVSLQTRAGAGLSLVGRLSQSTSKNAVSNAILTAYNTPTGLASMVYSLSYLPEPTSNSRLVIQVPTVTPVGESFALSPTLAPFNPALSILPEHFTVLLSATAQEAIVITALSYRLTNSHVIHLFDHHGTTRESGLATSLSLPTYQAGLSVEDSLAGAGYKLFDYAGDTEAHTVIVVLNGPLSQAAKPVASKTTGLGIVSVRLLRPWKEEALRAAIPASTKSVYVLDDVPTEYAQGSLYLDVFSSLLDSPTPAPTVKSLRVTPARLQAFLHAPSALTAFILNLLPQVQVPASPSTSGDVKKLLFFSTPKAGQAEVPEGVERIFTSPTLAVRRLTDYDAFSKPGGIVADRVVIAKKGEEHAVPLHFTLPINSSAGEADFISVLDPSILKTHSIAAHLKPSSPLLVVTDWSPAELASNIHPETAALIRKRQLHLCTINVKEIAEAYSSDAASIAVQNAVTQLAFLRLYLGQLATEDAVLRLAAKTLGECVQGIDLSKLGAHAWAGLVEVELPEVEASDASSSPLKLFDFNAIAVDTADGETVVNGAKLGSWHDAAKHIIFPSAFTPPIVPDGTTEYPRDPALRPEVPEHTFLVTCTVNKRLTPLEYDRNVFHLEFDTSGTGLKYAIGEALGVHGWNDADDILEFCEWYGVDPNKVITIPIPGGDGSQMHSRTVFQALQQQVDLFGKPGKTFYADLAEYASRQTDQYALRFIASPEGSATFKKLSEKDTVHFADILRRYPSARPGIEKLCEIVGDIKPRHYSIASAQAVVGDRVDLLVVSVDWVTPSGSPRYGQCTRYLAGLKVGQKVTVSIKPSVMKLPPDNTQPIIMAGLGTGAAPFRAFLQYRAHLASQGIPIGPTYYYFGSRHRSQEYLYGEEIEAFILDGTITRAGLAFSRDQKQKIYIQNKMVEDGKDLARMLLRENGVFYLCGPTWPVPDVFEALVSAMGLYEGVDAERAGSFLEGLKDEERYVLEVY
ncbi:assimilatory sulfite reductase [Cristinia sonorae]|uniref:assimilatory sulfite reductase (NADPH) n=1 Tax=Cristinia sonorae TaxID=1940300 RepID=A0A8K0UX70_9AGAR|nr:assimilatory sulfite reductase [Cristinia sonorae]